MSKRKVLFACLLATAFATSAGALVACGDEVDPTSGNNNSNKHVVTFDANGGAFGTEKQVKLDTDVNGKIITPPTDPTYDDHTFKGYTFTKDSESLIALGKDGYKFTTDITVFAKWEEVEPEPEITITFIVGDYGTMTDSATAKAVDGKLTSLPEVSADTGWTWNGWYTAATDGQKVTTDTVFTESSYVYAQYTQIVDENALTITLDVGEHGTVESNTLKTVYGKLLELPEVEETGDYKFLGWYTAATGGEKVTTDTEFEEDATIYARYMLKDGLYINNKLVAELKEQSPSFGAERQFGVTGVELSAGDVVTLMIDGKPLTHEAGTLELWLASAFNPHGVTLNQANGTFVVDEGEDRRFYIYARYYTDNTPCWSIDFSDGVVDDEPLILNGLYLVGTGFTNANWNLSSKNYIDPTDGLIVEFFAGAEFKITSCNNIDDPDGGRVWDHNDPSHYSMAAGSEGLEFDNIGASGGGSVVTPGQYLIKVTGTGANARFVFSEYREEYTITLNVGAGTLADGEDNAITTVNGMIESLPTPTPNDESKMFNGWYTAAEGGTKITTATVFEANGNIYAQYIDKPNQEYTITFNAGEHGTCTAEPMETVNGRLTQLPTVTPATGWIFDGWCTAAENGDKVDTDYDFTSSIELIALYSAAPSVTITSAAPTMKIGDTLTLQATTENFDGALAWKSSATIIVTVNATTGAIQAKKPGTATITVTAGTATATLTVTVLRTYYLRGSIMGWDPAVTTLTQSGIAYFVEDVDNPGVYKAKDVTIKRNDEFKIASVGEAWNNKFTGDQFTLTGMTQYFELTGTAGDKNVKCKDSGIYTVTLNLTNASSPVITITLVQDLPEGITSATAFTVNGAALSVGWNGTTAVNFTQDSTTGKWSATTTFTISAAGQFQFRWKKDGTQMYVDSRVNYTGKPKIDNFDDIEGLTSTYGNGNDGNYTATAAAVGTYTVTMTVTAEGDVESIVVTKL